MLMLIGVVAWWAMPNVVWNYTVAGSSGGVTIRFEEPRVSLTFEGIRLPEGDGGGSGTLMVSGLGFQSGHGQSSSGYSERQSYAWGRAEFIINDRAIHITDAGKKITVAGRAFSIRQDAPLELRIDSSGRVIREE
jgi:hypothetical protein